MTFRFGNGVHVVPGGALLLLSKGLLRDLGCHISLRRAHLLFEKLAECEQWWKANTRSICFYP